MVTSVIWDLKMRVKLNCLEDRKFARARAMSKPIALMTIRRILVAILLMYKGGIPQKKGGIPQKKSFFLI